MRQLTALDAQFLALETPRQYGHVAGVAILDPSTAPGGKLELADLQDLIVERLALVPPLRWRLAEVPLGSGFLDLPKIIATLRRARPEVHFNLEMMTRDPLKIPCLTKKYWTTFPNLPGRHLADTLHMVRTHAAKEPLPRVSGLGQEEKLKREDENVRRCVSYAREHMSL